MHHLTLKIFMIVFKEILLSLKLLLIAELIFNNNLQVF